MCVCVCVTVEHTGLPVPVEMQLDLCRYTSLCSCIQTCVFYGRIVLPSVCMHDLYLVRGHYYYAVGMYADVVRKGTQGYEGDTHFARVYFVDV